MPVVFGGVFVLLTACTAVPESDAGSEATGDTTGESSATGESSTTDEGGTTGEDDTELPTRPNWHEDLAPLVYASCVGCHSAGNIAPFSLETYEQAAPWGELLAEAVVDQIMPPWGALDTEECQPQHEWRNDTRLSEEQRQMFVDWVAADMPEGDPALAAPLPEPPSLDLDQTNVVLQNPAPIVVGGNQDSFVCVVVDPGNSEDVWITGIQNIADNAEVVHHVLSYVDADNATAELVDEDGKFTCPGGFISLDGVTQISTWVPGGVPTVTPPEVGFPMPVGSKVIMAYHYHPTGAGDELDQSSIALRWTTEQPALTGYMGVAGATLSQPSGLLPGPNDPLEGPLFEIPPDVADHTELIQLDIGEGVPPIAVFTIGTHMHYVGVDMKIWIEREGEEICLVQTPKWDFGWQRLYDIAGPVDEMPYIQGGDKVFLRCTYNNTLDNPALAGVLAEAGLDAPVTVGVGEESLDEMCADLFGLASNLPLDELL